MIVSLITALSRNGVIGVGNRLPWHLPEDLKRFKALTRGHAVIMGRKTHESIGRPLPDRTNIVVTRDGGYVCAPGVKVATSLDEALRTGHETSDEVFVIGGAEIYRLALPRADRLYLTRIERDWEGDAFFPEWDATAFGETWREEHPASPDRPFAYTFLNYEKRR